MYLSTDLATEAAIRSLMRAATSSATLLAMALSCGVICASTLCATFSESSAALGRIVIGTAAFAAGCAGPELEVPVMRTGAGMPGRDVGGRAA